MKASIKNNLVALALVSAIAISAAQNSLSRPLMEARQHHSASKTQINTMDKMDFNQDGVITEEDILQRMLNRTEKRFQRMDQDDDDFLTYTEFTQRPRHFAEIDHDALKSCIESALTTQSHIIPPTPDETFVLADSDSDEQISRNEFNAFVTEMAALRFSSLDSDGDGQLSDQERTEAKAFRTQMRQIKYTCISEQNSLNL